MLNFPLFLVSFFFPFSSLPTRSCVFFLFDYSFAFFALFRKVSEILLFDRHLLDFFAEIVLGVFVLLTFS